MVKRIIVFLFFLLSFFLFNITSSDAQFGRTPPGVGVQEEDGSPDTRALILKFTNGTVTDNGDGTVSVSNGGGTSGTSVNTTPTPDVVYITDATHDFCIGGTTLGSCALEADESAETFFATQGYKLGDGTDTDFTVMTVILASGNQTIQWDDANQEWDFSAPINASGVGQSALNQGLIVNSAQGANGDDDDFIAYGDTVTYINCDASADTCTYIAALFSGKIDADAGAVNDDDCTGEIGKFWFDDTDNAFEFCNADSGTPSVLGSGGTAVNEVILPVQSAKLTGTFAVDQDATEGADLDASEGSWLLLFDATTDEGAVWQFRMPNNYSSAPVLKIHYTMASATTGTVEFEGAIMCVSDADAADIATASFSTIAVGSATVPGTAGYLDVISITLTDDSCAAGDSVWVYLSTDSDDGTNDTAAGDREVVDVSLSYTGS